MFKGTNLIRAMEGSYGGELGQDREKRRVKKENLWKKYGDLGKKGKKKKKNEKGKTPREQ